MLYSSRNKKLLRKQKFAAYFIRDNLSRLSAQNRNRDYAAMLKSNDAKLWDLHRALEAIRIDGEKNYDSYDYGNGYYYQSMASIGVSGYRNTEQRMDQLQLRDKLAGETVLDIGSNSGFLLLSAADVMKSATGIEFNPYLVKTSDTVKAYLDVENVDFLEGSFEDLDLPGKSFSVILSLANHSTYDGNTKQSIDSYFEKISGLAKEDGILIFESHPPQIEPEDKLEKTIETIERYFTILDRPDVQMSGFLDKNRSYVIAQKK